MPTRRDDSDAEQRAVELAEARMGAWVQDTLAAAGAPVGNAQREAWAKVHALEVPTASRQ
jgi:hypothetical protein